MYQHIYKRIIDNFKNDKVNLIAIHGPQGVGKSTTCKKLEIELNKLYPTIVLSLDDFYLNYLDMKKFLNSQQNELYKYRGLAGTHDLELMYSVISKLLKQVPCEVPIFDKNKYQGFGDRVDYRITKKKYRIIILEGWLLGYKPIVNLADCQYSLFNKYLEKYNKIQTMFDELIVLEAEDINYIYNWRLEAEDKNGLNFENFERFMKPYLVIYKNYIVNTQDKLIINKDRKIINDI